jgi:TetR/AcrR family fatty acid metabolism transcriptional regulator
MPRKTDDPIQAQLIEARRNQILDSAIHVFAEKGFQHATIRDVAKAAGIADGTIYNYFANKNALLLGILNRLNQTEAQAQHFTLSAGMDIRAFIRLYLRQRFAALGAESLKVSQALFSEILVNPELRELFYQQVIESTFVVVEEFFRKGAEAGLIRPVDIPLTMRAITSMTLGLIVMRILGDPQIERRWNELPDVLADLLLEGMAPK